MNIVREQREQNTSLIKVTVGEQDYAQEVDKALREYKRKANIPGFRPGMVPMGIIKKMYGKGVLAEQSYRKASNAVFEYLQKENIDYLGDVIPSEEQGAFDFDNGKEFEFVFEIGEAPEIKLDLSEKDKLTYHKIKIEKKMHDDYRSNFLRRFGLSRLVNRLEDSWGFMRPICWFYFHPKISLRLILLRRYLYLAAIVVILVSLILATSWGLVVQTCALLALAGILIIIALCKRNRLHEDHTIARR